MSNSIRLSPVAINCPDAAALAAGATRHRFQLQLNPDHCTVRRHPPVFAASGRPPTFKLLSAWIDPVWK
jgi:hypothetical protein